MNIEKYTDASLAVALVSYDDQMNSYDDMLDQAGAVEVAGFEYYPSHILKNVDPIAYRLGFNDYFSDCISEQHWVEIDGKIYVECQLEEEEEEEEEV